MTDQNRTPAGVPAGGQFAGHNRSEASINLERKLNIASARVAEAEYEESKLLLQLLAQNIVDAHPEAVTAKMSLNDNGGLYLDALLDEDGDEIGISTGIQFTFLEGYRDLSEDNGPLTARYDTEFGYVEGADIDVRRAAAGK